MIRALTQASSTDLEQLASLFRILGDKTRIQMLLTLIERDKNVTEICETLHLPQPTASHHLSLLRMSNIVHHRRDGKQVYYGLNGRVRIDNGRLVLDAHGLAVGIAGKDAVKTVTKPREAGLERARLEHLDDEGAKASR